MDSTALNVTLGVMALFVLVCLTYVGSLWKLGPDPDERAASSGDPSGLVKVANSFREPKVEGSHMMNSEDALIAGLRMRTGLAAGILGVACIVLICATVIICVAINRQGVH